MQYLTVAEAQQIVLENLPLCSTEIVTIEKCSGRVLAENIRANRDLPPYDISAMDGFALRSSDVQQASTSLQIVEDIRAGDMPKHTLQAGQCARIMTGAPVPAGADAVIRMEDTTELGAQQVQINIVVKAGNDIRCRGESMRDGEIVLHAGTEITPGVVGVLATVKCAQLQVYRRPRVAILSTGDELEGMDEPVDPNKIPESNSYALMAQLQAIGIQPTLLGIARDTPEELRAYIQRGLDYDVLLVSGGTSVGVHDYVRPTIEALGVNMLFWRVAMKPGHPIAFGKLGDTCIFGLPGNPVSSMVCFEQFTLPALRSMMGYPRLYRRTIRAKLSHKVKHQPGRTEYIRVTLSKQPSGYIATSTGPQGSGMLLSMAKADGLAILPAECTGLDADSEVEVQLLEGMGFETVVQSGQ